VPELKQAGVNDADLQEALWTICKHKVEENWFDHYLALLVGFSAIGCQHFL
jgi:hypothetical protein